MDGSAIHMKAVSAGYGGGPVVHALDWEVGPGERWLLLGPSGCGKTTVLHLVAGFLPASAGSVRVLGRDLGGMSASARDRFRGKSLAVVFQRQHLVSALTVEGNLRLACELAGRRFAREAALGTLERLGVAALARRRPHELSGGEAQRVAIARALVVEPAILIADEPTASLDDRNAATVIDVLIAEAERSEATLVVATHDGRVRERFERRLVLEEGRAVA